MELTAALERRSQRGGRATPRASCGLSTGRMLSHSLFPWGGWWGLVVADILSFFIGGGLWAWCLVSLVSLCVCLRACACACVRVYFRCCVLARVDTGRALTVGFGANLEPVSLHHLGKWIVCEIVCVRLCV